MDWSNVRQRIEFYMDSASANQVGPVLILGSDVSGWHDVVNELHCALDSNIAERDSSHQGS